MSCSHSRFELLNVDPGNYKTPNNVWIIQPGDGKCIDCKEQIRVIRKTCVDHGIQQPWEATNIHICQHDHVSIKNKTKNPSKNRYEARLECVLCKINSPVYCTYVEQIRNGNKVEILTSDWTSDREKQAAELEINKNNKQ